MVGPVPESERAAFTRLLKVGVAILVGLSTGLVAVQTDATLPQVGGAMVVGLLVGGGLAWYVVPSRSPLAARRARTARENPFRNDGGGDADATDDGYDDSGGTDSTEEDSRGSSTDRYRT